MVAACDDVDAAGLGGDANAAQRTAAFAAVSNITLQEGATVLSTQSLMGRLFFAVLSPLIGYISDVISLQTAFMVWGVIVFVGGLISLSYLRANKVI